MKDAVKEKQQRDKKVSAANSGSGQGSSSLNSNNTSNSGGNSSNSSSSNGASIKMEPSDGPMTPMKVSVIFNVIISNLTSRQFKNLKFLHPCFYRMKEG